MSPFIALLRGINVGGHRKIPMAELRDCLSSAGLHDVRTYLQSGNAVFRSDAAPDALAPLIAEAVNARFGFRIAVFLYAAGEWERIVAANPFPDFVADPTKLVVMLTRGSPEAFADKLSPAARDGEEIRAAAGAVFLKLPRGQAGSKLAEDAYRAVGPDGTARNWRTVTALRDLAAAPL